jgi:ribosomal protein S11
MKGSRKGTPFAAQLAAEDAAKKAAELSERYLELSLKAEDRLECRQKDINKECLGKGCPLY